MGEQEHIPEAHCVAMFHGEQWFKCPHCQSSFEYFTVTRDCIKIGNEKAYICPECGGKLRIT